MPEVGHRLLRDCGDDVVGVLVTIGTGKYKNPEFHGSRLAGMPGDGTEGLSL